MNKLLSITTRIILSQTKYSSLLNVTRSLSSLNKVNNLNLLAINSTLNRIQYNSYSKKTKKDGKDIKKPKIQLTKNELNSHFEFDEMIKNFQSAVETLKDTYNKKLSLKLNQSTIESIPVKTLDGDYTIGELAQVTLKGTNLIVVDLINTPQYLKQVQEAIVKASLGINPQLDKTALYIQIPKLTREHRESLSKSATLIYNETVSKLQNTFSKNNKKVSNLEHVSEDTIAAIKDQVIYSNALKFLLL